MAPREDETAIADAIGRLLEDEALRARLVQRGRDLAARHLLDPGGAADPRRAPVAPRASDERAARLRVVVSFEARDDLAACLASIDAHGGAGVEVVVVDNASTDGSADAAARTQARLIANGANLGFGRACNQGAAAAQGAYVLFLNPDATLTPGALETMTRVLDEDAGVGIVGPRTLSDDGTPQVSFGPALGPPPSGASAASCAACAGATRPRCAAWKR